MLKGQSVERLNDSNSFKIIYQNETPVYLQASEIFTDTNMADLHL